MFDNIDNRLKTIESEKLFIIIRTIKNNQIIKSTINLGKINCTKIL